MEMEKAQLCVTKCKRAEKAFNRAQVMNNEASGAFINRCVAKVGLKDFRGYSVADEGVTKQQANRMLYCITTGRKISEKIDLELQAKYLDSYKNIIDSKMASKYE